MYNVRETITQGHFYFEGKEHTGESLRVTLLDAVSASPYIPQDAITQQSVTARLYAKLLYDKPEGMTLPVDVEHGWSTFHVSETS